VLVIAGCIALLGNVFVFLDRQLLAVTVAAWVASLFLCLAGYLSCPFVEMTAQGVTVAHSPFRKRHFPWNALIQVGVIHEERHRRYPFPVVLILPGGSERRKGKDWFFLERNTLHCVTLPRTEEILEFVKTHYGPLDFDDFAGLNDWEKKYYESIYTPRKEMKK
jgi:hypothetical protein